MSNQRHLLLVAGFLITMAPVGVGQVNMAKPGEPVERHLSSDQASKEWALDSKGSDNVKRIKVCRVETVFYMRFRQPPTPPLFPYTTLFRLEGADGLRLRRRRLAQAAQL